MSGKKDFRDKDEYRLSSFYSVVASQDGSMLVAENGNEIYSNEELLELAGEVNVKTDNIGTIGSLMYYKADKGGYTLVVFLDNSLNQKSMSALLKYTLYGGILAIVVFFFLSVYLARMIIRPLEENHIKQKQFISDAGHELKTPISVVSANAELLAREIGENQWLANIQYENERMGALVTQLLDLARTENVTPQMEIVDFSHLVSGETLPFESVIYENGMVFHCEIQDKILVHGNAMQLKQITAILLDNAVKHSTAGGEILLTLKKEHGRAVLSVINFFNFSSIYLLYYECIKSTGGFFMGFQTVFKRYEIKYMLTQEQKQKVLKAMEHYMALDGYGRTTIRNLYFDTDNYRLIRRSIDKPAYKEKLRVRSYTQADADRTVFVELKKKYQSVVYKRRIALPEFEAMRWLAGEHPCPKDIQISREVDYFLSYYQTLRPVVFLSYEREAYYEKNGEDFRITFDDTILCRQEDLSLKSEVYGTPLLPEGMVLMEIKCSGGMPLWMTRVLSEQHIYHTSFSKYGTAYQTMIFPKTKSINTHKDKEAA